jgi:hypothetical protein
MLAGRVHQHVLVTRTGRHALEHIGVNDLMTLLARVRAG